MPESKPSLQVKSASPTVWALVVLFSGLVTRLLMFFLYEPVAYSDTPSYRRLAEAVLGGFARYDGTRTPGYPVFLALVGDDESVWLVQLFLGLATSMLLFYIGWKLTGKPWFGGLIGLSHSLNLGQLFFESSLLTECLTTFLLVLTLAGALVWVTDPKRQRLWLAFLLGLTSALTLLVRPLFIYLPFYLLLFIWISHRASVRSASQADTPATDLQPVPPIATRLPWSSVIAFLVPVILLLGGWLTFIHAKYGDWALTTMTGYHLIQHTGGYFEYVPDEYASVRDTYLKYRDAQIAQFGTQTNAIWGAIPEMSQASGYNFYDLSRLLARLSIQLIVEHPLLFAQNALSGWWMFWRTAVYWSAEALRYPSLARGINLLVQVQRAALFLVNLLFISGSLYAGMIEILSVLRPGRSFRRLVFTHPTQRLYFWFLAGTIWIASLLQTLLDHGDNPRFLVPLQSLVVLWVALFFFYLLHDRSPRLPAQPE